MQHIGSVTLIKNGGKHVLTEPTPNTLTIAMDGGMPGLPSRLKLSPQRSHSYCNQVFSASSESWPVETQPAPACLHTHIWVGTGYKQLTQVMSLVDTKNPCIPMFTINRLHNKNAVRFSSIWEVWLSLFLSQFFCWFLKQRRAENTGKQLHFITTQLIIYVNCDTKKCTNEITLARTNFP